MEALFFTKVNLKQLIQKPNHQISTNRPFEPTTPSSFACFLHVHLYSIETMTSSTRDITMTTNPGPEPRWLITDSNSSRKMVEGAWNRANSNNTRTCDTMTSQMRANADDVTHQFLWISSPFTNNCWSRNIEESGSTLGGDSFREKRLPGSRRPVEEDSFPRS